MDPFKTGPIGLFATALVSLGKSGGFSLGVILKPTAIANRPVSFDAESVQNGLVLISYGMDINCLKTVFGESVLTQIAKIKMTGSIIGPVGKKIKFKKKIKKIKITVSIIGPAMAGPTGPFATALTLSKTVKEKDLGVTMNANMKVYEQCRIAASKGNQILGILGTHSRIKRSNL